MLYEVIIEHEIFDETNGVCDETKCVCDYNRAISGKLDSEGETGI